MTVRQLRAMLAGYKPDAQVVLNLADGYGQEFLTQLEPGLGISCHDGASLLDSEATTLDNVDEVARKLQERVDALASPATVVYVVRLS